jgi:hypothetical protein
VEVAAWENAEVEHEDGDFGEASCGAIDDGGNEVQLQENGHISFLFQLGGVQSCKPWGTAP